MKLVKADQDAIGFLLVGAAIGVAVTKSPAFRALVLDMIELAAKSQQAKHQTIEVQAIDVDVSDL